MEVVDRIVADEEDGVVGSLTADKGYFAIEEIAQIQEFDIRTVIGTPTRPGAARKAWPPRCESSYRAACPSRASLGRRFCASAACIWNAASSTSLMKAECADHAPGNRNLSKRQRLRRLA